MKSINKAAVSFYDKPKADLEKERMQEELETLKEQLSQQKKITPSMSVEEQRTTVARR